jgi:hypothetical protein
MINDNRRLVQCLEPLRMEAPGFVSAVDARILRWHGDLLDGAGLDPRLASLLSAMSMGLAWRPSAELDGGVARVTELLSPQLSRRGQGPERSLPGRRLDHGPSAAGPRVLVRALL